MFSPTLSYTQKDFILFQNCEPFTQQNALICVYVCVSVCPLTVSNLLPVARVSQKRTIAFPALAPPRKGNVFSLYAQVLRPHTCPRHLQVTTKRG